MGSLTNVIIRSGIVILTISALTLLGNVINDFFFIQWLTTFFVLIRTLIKPLTFIWDFQTSFYLIGLSLSILISYFTFKAFLVIKNIMSPSA